jgi:hypothetical protein
MLIGKLEGNKPFGKGAQENRFNEGLEVVVCMEEEEIHLA